MPFRGLTMLKSPKLIIKGGLCYGFAMVAASTMVVFTRSNVLAWRLHKVEPHHDTSPLTAGALLSIPFRLCRPVDFHVLTLMIGLDGPHHYGSCCGESCWSTPSPSWQYPPCTEWACPQNSSSSWRS